MGSHRRRSRTALVVVMNVAYLPGSWTMLNPLFMTFLFDAETMCKHFLMVSSVNKSRDRHPDFVQTRCLSLHDDSLDFPVALLLLRSISFDLICGCH